MSRLPEHFFDVDRQVLVEQVGVDVHCRGDVRMPEEFPDHVEADPGPQRVAREAVA